MTTKIVAAVVSIAAAGSMALGGVALAWDGGGNGTGGSVEGNCANINVLDLLNGIGALGGKGSADVGTCNGSANGTGGNN